MVLARLRDGVGQVVLLAAVPQPALVVAVDAARAQGFVAFAAALDRVGDEDAADGRADAADADEEANADHAGVDDAHDRGGVNGLGGRDSFSLWRAIEK